MTQFPTDGLNPEPNSQPNAQLRSLLPPEEQMLVEFLQSHAPAGPAAAVDLEERILEAVNAELTATGSTPTPIAWGRVRRALASGVNRPQLLGWSTAIAASLLMVWGSFQWLLTPQPSRAELEQLEAFLQTNWTGIGGV